ncbi:MAG: molecular chaperone DnaJ [Myxococcales bacterium]|nr:molecular chaperone DnaJ [Myxococcales bacterium]
MREDYYVLLGVERDVDAQSLKKAYRKAAMACHPDRNPGDAEAEARFKAISEAYGVLSDPEKRRIYDRYGHEGLEGSGFQGFGDLGDIFGAFGDLFGEMFGFGGRRARQRRGADLRYDLSMTLEECLTGAEPTLEIPRDVPCEACAGTGAADGTRPKTCGTCGGRGQVAVNRGFISMATTCPRCRGGGQIIESPCTTCSGRGTQQRVDKVTVKVPPGVGHGMKLRVTGKGDPGPEGAVPGDLYVLIHVPEHKHFERHGDELLGEVDVDMVQAALGTEVEVPTLDGTATVAVQAGTQPGTVVRIAGEGMPRLNGGGARGDLHLRVNVTVPTGLSDAQRGLLEEFARLGAQD